jgi:mono/diheme cytochrome c family protein
MRKPNRMNEIILAALALGAIVLITVLLIYSQATVSSPPEGHASKDSSDLFRQVCAQCHGKNGEGVASLTPPLRRRGLPIEYIKSKIQKGGQKMPALPFIQGDALDRLAKYVSGLK